MSVVVGDEADCRLVGWCELDAEGRVEAADQSFDKISGGSTCTEICNRLGFGHTSWQNSLEQAGYPLVFF